MANKPLTLKIAKDMMVKAAKNNAIHPSKVTLAMLKGLDKDITDWQLRAFGGITALRRHFPISDKDLAGINEQKDLRSYIAALEKQIGERDNVESALLKDMNTAFKSIGKSYKIKPVARNKNKIEMCMEGMLSDIHFGKKTQTFNLNILKSRLQKYTTDFLFEKQYQEQNGYQVTTIILSILGDIIESYTMHGGESAACCEFGNSRQIQESIDCLFDYVILPIAKTGAIVHIPAVPGNHDRTEKNRTYNYPGETYVTWIIYKALEKYCKISGLNNVTFDITRDNYTTYKLFNKHLMLFEHLENISSPTKKVLEDLIRKRENQVGHKISMLRGGHWHEYVCYGRGRAIVNESVCGQDSFAKVNGYASIPGQTINLYVNDNNLPNCFLYSRPVFLG